MPKPTKIDHSETHFVITDDNGITQCDNCGILIEDFPNEACKAFEGEDLWTVFGDDTEIIRGEN